MTNENRKSNSPIIILRKFQMTTFNEEPLAQTQLREKQKVFTLQSDIQLIKLRSESQEERYKNIDKTMVELIDKQVSSQKKQLLRKYGKRIAC